MAWSASRLPNMGNKQEASINEHEYDRYKLHVHIHGNVTALAPPQKKIFFCLLFLFLDFSQAILAGSLREPLLQYIHQGSNRRPHI